MHDVKAPLPFIVVLEMLQRGGWLVMAKGTACEVGDTGWEWVEMQKLGGESGPQAPFFLSVGCCWSLELSTTITGKNHVDSATT